MPSHREDFPLLRESKAIYIDSAATAQRPDCVIQAEADFYARHNANPLRGFYELGVDATQQLETARDSVRGFLHAADSAEIIFTRNTTESLNLVAYSYALTNLRPGDEVVVSIMEHHSNLLPWQMATQRTGATLRFLECDPDGSLPVERIQSVITDKTRLVAVTHVSNVLGHETPVKAIVAAAHAAGAVVVLDAAQSAPHIPLDVQVLHTVRYRVQVRHGADRGVAAPGGCPAACGDGLLIRKTRLSEMHMHVTKAGKNNIFGRIEPGKTGDGKGGTNPVGKHGSQRSGINLGFRHIRHADLLSAEKA